ncbi:ABC transporter ATP-binding protein [Dehalococcoides mccartyi]|nr:ABC transporter ATP-binding protein [Dehalococcoides mccartyi]
MTALLELKHTTKVFGSGFFNKRQTVAVDDITFSLAKENPSMIALAGESGSGKTTLSRLLLGVTNPSSGQVLYDGQDVKDMSRAERKSFRREVQPIFQDPFAVYNPFYKADHLLNVAVAKFGLASSKEEGQHLIDEALSTVGLRPDETVGRYPHQLSGGQRQRIMVARALLLKPKVILADEPVSMVDASLRATILESLRTLNREIGISILYVTHDLTTAYQICQNIVILYRGTVVESGDVDKVIKDPKHPYTQLLVSSIPQLRGVREWENEGEIRSIDEAGESAGCKFANRCPSVMEKCWSQVPDTFQVDTHQAAKCFLFEDKPKVESADISDTFVTPKTADRVTSPA